MPFSRQRVIRAIKALRELGPQQVGLYAWYQVALRSGWLRRQTNPQQSIPGSGPAFALRGDLLSLPGKDELRAIIGDSGCRDLCAQADEITAGYVCLFGGEPRPLQLTIPGALHPWADYETGRAPIPAPDVKLIWEPGRFGWAFTLGRAYHLSGEERYPEAFWQAAGAFLKGNPSGLGPHWSSAQEAALRLIALVFAAQVFAPSPHSTPERMHRLAQAVAEHARRIPPTLAYARAQNNNHLLTEAAGLYTAGCALPGHPEAARWRRTGWRWFNRGIQSQIAADGAYTQHSTNYHRLMLQSALWVHALACRQPRGGSPEGSTFPEATRSRLVAAAGWLFALLDPDSGRVPNLGPNDGAYILPLAAGLFHDYRPVLQAAGRAFLGCDLLEAGPWDEMALWFGCGQKSRPAGPVPASLAMPEPENAFPPAPHVIRAPDQRSWAYLRAARFTDRPGHADQLHVDLWWRGINLAQDAGTYLYNAAAPWENALSGTPVHNTVTVAGQDQMTRAGRFLYLDWAQGKVLAHERAPDGSWERLAAQHNGYRRLGVLHTRILKYQEGRWLVEDQLLSAESNGGSARTPSSARLHWLLPDLPWEIDEHQDGTGAGLRLHTSYGWVTLRVEAGAPAPPEPVQIQVVRAGEVVYGAVPAAETWGWVSPTYAVKEPALSFSMTVHQTLPILLRSEWLLPETPAACTAQEAQANPFPDGS